MSLLAPALDRLPEAMQKKVYENLGGQDLLSLAVVSKAVSRIARPRLYLKSVLTIPREEEPIRDIWSNRWSKKQQNRYCKTLKKHPELGEQAHTLYLTISQNRIGFSEIEEEEDTATINQVVGALNKFQHLVRLEVFQNRNVALPGSILSALPPTLAIVNLEHSALSEENCLALIRRLPLLEYLKVFILPGTSEESHFPLHHAKLGFLAINLPAASPSFILAITHDVPNLCSFQADFEGLIKVKGSPFLRQLKKLFVLGQPTYWQTDDPGRRQLAVDLGIILDDCLSLEFLAVHAEYEQGIAWEVLVSIEDNDVFQHIPPSLSVLDLRRVLIKPSYILSTVRRLAPQLKHLTTTLIRENLAGDLRVSWASPPHEATRIKVWEVCQANGISWNYIEK